MSIKYLTRPMLKIILIMDDPYLQEPEHPADKVLFEDHYWNRLEPGEVWSLVMECCADQVRRRLSKMPGVIAISAKIDGRKRYLAPGMSIPRAKPRY